MIKPSIGRFVWFYPENGMGEQLQPFAAIIAYVHGDRMVNLAYFDAQGVAMSRTSVPLMQEGDVPQSSFFCTWMPFQIGQQKAQEVAK